MSTVKEFHDLAMAFTDRAIRERATEGKAASLQYFERALEAELSAIAGLDTSDGLLWSVLYRSAGSLALDCGRIRQAEQLAATALAGNPDPEIAEELRDLLENIYFHRHLHLSRLMKNASLKNSERVGAGIEAPLDADSE